MLEELRDKVGDEAEAEAKTYDKFACFCQDVTAEKASAIETGGVAKTDLQAKLNQAASDRQGADEAIASAGEDITKLEGELEDMASTRKGQRFEYEKNEMDLTGAVQAITSAIHALKAAETTSGASASLAQLLPTLGDSAGVLRRALALADALGVGEASAPSRGASPAARRRLLAALQGSAAPGGEIPDSVYEFHSGDIITTLEDLKVAFKAEKDELDQDEVASKQTYAQLKQEKEKLAAEHATVIEEQKRLKASKASLAVSLSQDLTATSARLLADQSYLADLSKTCHEKALLWDQRSRMKADELQALASALATLAQLADDSKAAGGSLLAFNARARALLHNRPSAARRGVHAGIHASPALALLRRHHAAAAAKADGSQGVEAAASAATLAPAAQVAALLRARGRALKSAALLRMAGEATADPLAKVKTLIQELIERLLKEAQDEASHKGWCDNEAGLAEQERDMRVAAVEELNGKLAVGEARLERLNMTAAQLATEAAELNDRLNESTVLREQERDENAKAMTEARDAKAAVETAMTTLRQFYGRAANEASAAFLQQTQAARAEPAAPDAGFDEAYGGAQGAGKGVLAMLEVLASDFERAATEAEKAEKASEQAHLELQTSSGSALAANGESSKANAEALADAEAEDSDNRQALTLNQQGLDKALEELSALHASCFDTGMTAEEKKAKREEEIEALNEALGILDGHAR